MAWQAVAKLQKVGEKARMLFLFWDVLGDILLNCVLSVLPFLVNRFHNPEHESTPVGFGAFWGYSPFAETGAKLDVQPTNLLIALTKVLL